MGIKSTDRTQPCLTSVKLMELARPLGHSPRTYFTLCIVLPCYFLFGRSLNAGFTGSSPCIKTRAIARALVHARAEAKARAKDHPCKYRCHRVATNSGKSGKSVKVRGIVCLFKDNRGQKSGRLGNFKFCFVLCQSNDSLPSQAHI